MNESERRNHFEKLQQRLRARSRQRGAAMVEGLVVIPFFMTIFAGTMLMGGVYAKRIHTQNEAREVGWRAAVTDNCDDVATGSLAQLDIVDSSDLGELASSPMAALCSEDFGTVTARARETHQVEGPFDFGGVKEITATTVVPCNETPIAGDVAYEHAIEFLWMAYQAQGDIPPDADPPANINLGQQLFGTPYPYGGMGSLGVMPL